MRRQTTLTLFAAIAVISATTVPLTTQTVDAQNLIPEWIKNNAKWWSEGQVDDKTFLNGIEFLIEQ